MGITETNKTGERKVSKIFMSYKILSDEEFGAIRTRLLSDNGELRVIKELKQPGMRESDWHWPTQIATYLAYELYVRGENANLIKGVLNQAIERMFTRATQDRDPLCTCDDQQWIATIALETRLEDTAQYVLTLRCPGTPAELNMQMFKAERYGNLELLRTLAYYRLSKAEVVSK